MIRDDYGRAYDSWPRTFKITDGTIYDRLGVGISQPLRQVLANPLTITHDATHTIKPNHDRRISNPLFIAARVGQLALMSHRCRVHYSRS